MENAAKALLMAGGILIGVFILALMVTLFANSSKLTESYDSTKQQEAIQQFNTNFTKYLGQEITIHDVITICNFASENGLIIEKSGSFNLNISQIDRDIRDAKDKEIYENTHYGKKVKVDVLYKMELDYNAEGVVSKVKFYGRSFKETNLP